MESKERFTPGPWKMVEDHDNFSHGIRANSVSTKNVETIFTVPRGLGPRAQEFLANAHLIAAAPEMYEMLKIFSESFIPLGERYGFDAEEVVKSINELLARARGEEEKDGRE